MAKKSKTVSGVMPAQGFSAGDVVQLVSGGPKMTVGDVLDGGKIIHCYGFGGGSGCFELCIPPAALKSANDRFPQQE